MTGEREQSLHKRWPTITAQVNLGENQILGQEIEELQDKLNRSLRYLLNPYTPCNGHSGCTRFHFKQLVQSACELTSSGCEVRLPSETAISSPIGKTLPLNEIGEGESESSFWIVRGKIPFSEWGGDGTFEFGELSIVFPGRLNVPQS